MDLANNGLALPLTRSDTNGINACDEESTCYFSPDVHGEYLTVLADSTRVISKLERIFGKEPQCEDTAGFDADGHSFDEEASVGAKRVNADDLERASEDYLSNLPRKSRIGSQSRREAVFSLCKSFIGTGILFTPYALRAGGMLTVVAMMGLMFFCSLYGVLSLIRCAENHGCKSYGRVAALACGKTGRLAVNVSVSMSQLGFCSVMTVFVANTVRDVYTSWIGQCQPEWDIKVETLILIQLVILLPLTIGLDRIRLLQPLINIADIAILFGLVSITSYSVYVICTNRSLFSFLSNWNSETKAIEQLSQIPNEISPNIFSNCVLFLQRLFEGTFELLVFNRGGILISLGIIAYVFEGITLLLPIRRTLKSSQRSYFALLSSRTLVGIALTVLCFAMISFSAFGAETPQLTFSILPRQNWAYAAQIAYSFALMISFPLQLVPVAEILEHFVFHKAGLPLPDTFDDKLDQSATTDIIEAQLIGQPEWRVPMIIRQRIRKLIRFCLVILTFFIALVGAEKLSNLVALIGASCCIPLAILYPVLFRFILNPTMEPGQQGHYRRRSSACLSNSNHRLAPIVADQVDHGMQFESLLECLGRYIPLRLCDVIIGLIGIIIMGGTTVYSFSTWDQDSHVFTHCEMLAPNITINST